MVHQPDTARIYVDFLMEKINQSSSATRYLKVNLSFKQLIFTFKGQVKDIILRRHLHQKFAGTSFIDEVTNLMPLKIENTLNNYKVSLLGKNPKDRASYNPSLVLSTIAGGDKVLVEDSKNLPPDWKDDNLALTT